MLTFFGKSLSCLPQRSSDLSPVVVTGWRVGRVFRYYVFSFKFFETAREILNLLDSSCYVLYLELVHNLTQTLTRVAYFWRSPTVDVTGHWQENGCSFVAAHSQGTGRHFDGEYYSAMKAFLYLEIAILAS